MNGEDHCTVLVSSDVLNIMRKEDAFTVVPVADHRKSCTEACTVKYTYNVQKKRISIYTYLLFLFSCLNGIMCYNFILETVFLGGSMFQCLNQ